MNDCDILKSQSLHVKYRVVNNKITRSCVEDWIDQADVQFEKYDKFSYIYLSENLFFGWLFIFHIFIEIIVSTNIQTITK